MSADRHDRSSKSTKVHHGADSRDALLRAGQEVFGEKGFDGTTVKDVADKAGVNISLISYHFGGKENLYRACIEDFALERIEATERLLKPASSREDFKLRLTLFAEEFIEIHRNKASVCKMIHRAMDNVDPVGLDSFKGSMLRMFNAVYGFVTEAQRTGLIRAELDAEISAGFLFGSLVHMIRSEPLRHHLGLRELDEPDYRALVVKSWVHHLVEGMLTPASSEDAKRLQK